MIFDIRLTILDFRIEYLNKMKQLSIMMAVFFLGANPAFSFNLFIFKGKIKRIFTSNEVH
jgi:hypothetical protein